MSEHGGANLIRLAGAYITWELHISSHYCRAATGEGSCATGSEVLRRLHTAYYALDRDERSLAVEAVRDWDWEAEAAYPAEEGSA